MRQNKQFSKFSWRIRGLRGCEHTFIFSLVIWGENLDVNCNGVASHHFNDLDRINHQAPYASTKFWKLLVLPQLTLMFIPMFLRYKNSYQVGAQGARWLMRLRSLKWWLATALQFTSNFSRQITRENINVCSRPCTAKHNSWIIFIPLGSKLSLIGMMTKSHKLETKLLCM